MAFENDSSNKSHDSGIIQHKVLIVDDVKIVAEKLRNALPKDIFIVESAVNIKSALDGLEEEPFPSVIVVDLYLPKEGGIYGGVNLIDKIKNKPKLKDIPIVAYSNFIHHIIKKRTTRKIYDNVLRRLEEKNVAGENVIDKNYSETETGEEITNINTIRDLADRIEVIVLTGGKTR